MPDCGFDPLCHLGGIVGGAVSDAAGNVLEEWATGVLEGLSRALVSMGAMWTTVPTPVMVGEDGNLSDTVGFLRDSTAYFVALLLMISLIIGGARIALEASRRSDVGRQLGSAVVTFIVVSAAGATLIQTLASAGDSFAIWVIDGSITCEGLGAGETCFGRNVMGLIGFAGLGGLGAILIIVLGLVATLVSLGQIALMFFRGGMLVLLAGAFPLAASVSGTEGGRKWFGRFMSWTIAFLLYKPVAGLVYAGAFRMAGSGDSLTTAITGIMMMIGSIIALPALMRLVAPAVSAVAGGSGGAEMAGLIGGVAVAKGAEMVGGAMSQAGSGGGESTSTSTSEDSKPSSSPSASTGEATPQLPAGNSHPQLPPGGGGEQAMGAGGSSTAGATAGAGAGASGAGASGAGASGAGAAAGTAASAAAGASTMGVSLAAQAVVETGKKVHGAAKGAVEDSSGG